MSHNTPVVFNDDDGNEIASIPVITLMAWRQAMRLEVKFPGMQMSRGRSCSAIIKSTLGFPRNAKKADILAFVEQVCEQVEEQREAFQAV